MNDTETRTYKVAEVADILSCDYKTVLRLIKDGRLRATLLGRSYRVSQKAINEFLGE